MMLSLRLLSALLATTVIFAAAPAARAGTYTVYGCQTPYGSSAPTDGWHVSEHSSVDYWKDACPGAVFMWMSASRSHANGDYADETFIAPANTTIQSYTLWRAVRLVPSGGYYYQAWERSAGQWHMVDGCTSAASCPSVGSTSSPFDKRNRLRRTADTGTDEVQLKVLCGRSDGCPTERSGVTASVWLFESQIALADNYAPQFAGAPSGPLVAPGAVLAGIVPVTIAATDRGGGVYQAVIEVDGRVLESQVLDSNGGACQQPFKISVPCQLSANGTVYLDTRALADGFHSVTLFVSDAAGNLAAWGPVAIRTVNNPCSPVPTVGGMRIHSAFLVVAEKWMRIHQRHRLVRTVHLFSHVTRDFLARPLAVGSLTTASGQPLAGATVCIAAIDDVPYAGLEPVGTAVTNASGVFSHRLGPGPSRTIFFIHRVLGGAIWTAVSITVRVPVHVHVSSHHLLNGQVMTWRGRLPGPIPNGLLGLMQVWRGTFWQTFEQVSVGPDGNWISRYRFSFTSGVQNYEFRLRVPHQSGYPYAGNTSAPFRVTVGG